MKKTALILVFMLWGCSGVLVPPDDFAYQEIQTQKFKIATWSRLSVAKIPIKVLIEGDGHSFDRWGAPTSNPTPRGRLLRNLAFNDDYPNILYVARPCQFAQDIECKQFYWTHGRFSEEVIDSVAQVIKSIAGDNEVILVGYSGGAQVAGLVAVRYKDIKVKKLITIAGNLDHPAWTVHHKLEPLDGSLSLTDYRAEYLKFPQIHYVGAEDSVIPSSITCNFIQNDDLITTIPNATHDSGFDSVDLTR